MLLKRVEEANSGDILVVDESLPFIEELRKIKKYDLLNLRGKARKSLTLLFYGDKKCQEKN